MRGQNGRKRQFATAESNGFLIILPLLLYLFTIIHYICNILRINPFLFKIIRKPSIMSKNTFSLKILMVMATCLTAMTVSAHSYLYIDRPDITADDIGKVISIPIKGHFENYVSAWELKFNFPAGMTPVSLATGSDMDFPYYDWAGRLRTYTASMQKSADYTHIIGSTNFPIDDYDEEQDIEEPYGTIKWAEGEYEDMLMLNVRIESSYQGGKIVIKSMATCGYDPRNESIALTPSSDNSWMYNADVNSDGLINISDYSYLLSLVTNYEQYIGRSVGINSEPSNRLLGDANNDGTVDLLDVAKVLDYFYLGTGYDGYTADKNRRPYDLYKPTTARCYLYIDDVLLTGGGQRITVPVKAKFEDYVSCWDVQFVFPEGLTPVDISAGADLNLTYIDNDGNEMTHTPYLMYNRDYYSNTRDLSHIMCAPLYPDYDPDSGNTYITMWAPGEYEEMFLLTLEVDEGYYGSGIEGGDIVVNTKATCGYDPRHPSTNYPLFSLEYDESWYPHSYIWFEYWHWPADVNMDGTINVTDVTNLSDRILSGDTVLGPYSPVFWEDYPEAGYADNGFTGDYCRDGKINVADISMLIDYMITDNILAPEGYPLYEYTSTSLAINPELNNELYAEFMIEPFEVVLNHVGQEINVPVNVYFSGPVSSWEMEVQFPEGLTPVGVLNGYGMTLPFTNDSGMTVYSNAQLLHNDSFTHFVGSTMYLTNYQSNGDDEYEPTGLAKWNPGGYNMFYIRLRIDDCNFGEGRIIINSKASCGYDSRPEIIQLFPSSLNADDFGEYLPGDVNLDGMLTRQDPLYICNYLLGNTDPNNNAFNNPDFQLLADVTQDGRVDIRDIEKILDVIMTEQWWIGHPLSVNETESYIAYYLLPGDLNGDDVLNVSDLTELIQLLLNEGSPTNPIADVNKDGVVNVSDITELINIVLNAAG